IAWDRAGGLTDVPDDAAGVITDGSTLSRTGALNISAHQHLAENNAFPIFQSLDGLLITGPTRTNVMDLQIVLISS
ncbi:MAG: hypothetical protein GY737_02205, partial [Desulfobacteraceae bacterium]|nr:hypothetical protein [Desulfobacteraceae bacterium]